VEDTTLDHVFLFDDLTTAARNIIRYEYLYNIQNGESDVEGGDKMKALLKPRREAYSMLFQQAMKPDFVYTKTFEKEWYRVRDLFLELFMNYGWYGKIKKRSVTPKNTLITLPITEMLIEKELAKTPSIDDVLVKMNIS
jgi:hypothetical protein